MWAQLPESHGGLFSEQYNPAYILVFLVVITLSYNGGTWGLAQRFYSVGAARDAKKAALLSGAMYLVYPLIIYIPVWASPIVLGEVAKPEETYALMAQNYFPALMPGLLGLFVASMFAATMSMVDSDLNALAAVFTKDIYQKTFNPDAPEKTLLKVGLLATALFGTITIISGLMGGLLGGAFNAMMQWYAAILAPVSVPLLFGMLNRRTTWRGALAAWFGGFATFVLLKYGLPAFGVETSWTIFTGGELLVTFGIFYAEGYINKLTPEEQVRVDELFEQIAPQE
jgi:SSS family solute:Na+ symporter